MLAEDTLFLGKDLLPWLLLAFGAAMVVGNGLALVRPPTPKDGSEPKKADPARAWPMIAIGALAAVWALATLLK